MTSIDTDYKDLIEAVLVHGQKVHTRNSDVLRLSIQPLVAFYTPLISIRKTAWRNCLREWEFFMSGSNNIQDLHPSVRSWWEPWADKDNGEIHFNYSRQFRHFVGDRGSVDQIQYLLDGVKDHPFSRRNVITTWNTADMTDSLCPLTNCHSTIIQTFVNPEDNSLDLFTYQRSVDLICGFPHNIFQMYSFLLWLAHWGKRKVGMLSWMGGDVHIYDSHRELAQCMLDTKVPDDYFTPSLVYSPPGDDNTYRADHFSLDGPYAPVLTDKAEMVV